MNSFAIAWHNQVMRTLPLGARGPKINRTALRAIRIERGYTQVTLGELADVDPSHICRIEAGIRTHPSPRVTKALADALRVDIRDLLAAELEGVAR